MPSLLDDYPSTTLLGLRFASVSVAIAAESLANHSPQNLFSYVVTPNADHFVRLQRDHGDLAALYTAAGCLLLDSRVVQGICNAIKLPAPPVITGSDLTFELFENHIDRGEPINIIGTTQPAVVSLLKRYGLTRVSHHCPPFGFESNPGLIEECAEFVETHPARFTFLACGAPRQELLAYRIYQRGRATGIGLCIGSAIDQIGGCENRAPAWMRQKRLEWLWRLVRQPARMGKRYLDDTRIFGLLLNESRHRGRDSKKT